MSKNYDLIATVDIDIENPVVDDASFDNLLILGPAPKGEHTAPDVGVYSDISEVADAGFVVSGEGADPVGVAARVAFSQSPIPTTVYIALQKLSADAIVAGETIEATNTAIDKYFGKQPDIAGCAVSFDAAGRCLNMVLEGALSSVQNTGIAELVGALVADGYKISVDGSNISGMADIKKLPAYKSISAMTPGSEAIMVPVKVGKEDQNPVSYMVAVSYPDPEVAASETEAPAWPVDRPDMELEEPAVTIQRALAMSGWYVLCTAGVDPAKYEDIAAFIETQEKMFCYTDLDYFKNGESSVGSVYFRSMGIYGRERSKQLDAEIPEANEFMNVAWVAKWLNYESGSETSAFKTLASVYPSELTTTEMKALEGNNMNFFVTVGNKNITMNGKTRGGEWADIIRFRDWLKNDMQVSVVNLFVSRPKVPYTDSGIALVQNQMIASLKHGQNAGGVAEDEFDEDGNTIPGFVTSVPLAASIPTSEKASRKLRKCKFKARLAGAIHFAEITGSLTYAL